MKIFLRILGFTLAAAGILALGFGLLNRMAYMTTQDGPGSLYAEMLLQARLGLFGGLLLEGGGIAALVFGFRKAGHDAGKIPFDPTTQRAVIRASICTGEQVAGFRDITTGHFTEVAVLKTEADKASFMEAYGLTDIKTEY